MIEPHTTTADFYDTLEPEPVSLYREAALNLWPVILSAAAFIAAAKHPSIDLAQVKFALGLEEKSMRQIANELDCTVAGISRGAKEFQKANNLPTPPCMKSDEASKTYRRTRQSQLAPREDA